MILSISEGKATLHTRMTPVVMHIVPRLEGHRKWLKGGGLRLEPTQYNIEILLDGVPNLEIQKTEPQRATLSGDQKDLLGNPTYESKTVPYDHQTAAQDKTGSLDHFALFMEQRTGKTKVILDRAGKLWASGDITGVLVVAPRGVHRQWVDSQIPQHYGAEYAARFWPMKELPDEMMPGSDLRWFTINIDAIRTSRGKKMCQEFITSHLGRILMVVDESHTIKNVRSQRWKAANDLGKQVRFRAILTGTPIAKDLLDQWAQFRWLDEDIIGIKYATSFKNEFCIMGGFDSKVIVGHKNVERLHVRTEPYTYRITQEEIGILPNMYETWTFDLQPFQRRMMVEMKQILITHIDSGEISTAANAAVAVMRLQQIANGFLMDDDKNIQYLFDDPMKNPRLIALHEYLDSIEGKVIIWARFIPDIELISGSLGVGKHVTYYGATSDKQRAENLAMFLDPDSDIDQFVANQAVGGTGLNMQGPCHRMFYYSNSDNSIDRWQSQDRTRAIGMETNVVVTDCVAVGSTDRKILANNKRKKNLSDMTLGQIRTWLETDDET
jgi:hypothetical protein